LNRDIDHEKDEEPNPPEELKVPEFRTTGAAVKIEVVPERRTDRSEKAHV
jgi:hypothetical protein